MLYAMDGGSEGRRGGVFEDGHENGHEGGPMILTENQLAALKELHVDLGEVIVSTAGVPWEHAKDQITGITYWMVLDWCKKLDTLFRPENQ